MGTLQVKVLETDGDGVSWPGSDVPAAVQSGWILKGPPRGGDDAAGCPQELGHISTSIRNP